MDVFLCPLPETQLVLLFLIALFFINKFSYPPIVIHHAFVCWHIFAERVVSMTYELTHVCAGVGICLRVYA